MVERFIEWKPNGSTLAVLMRILDVLTDYKSQGYRLTLRQLYYQLVARDIIPNSIQSYNRIGNIVSKGRLSGYIDWDMLKAVIPDTNHVRVYLTNLRTGDVAVGDGFIKNNVFTELVDIMRPPV